MHVQPPNQSGRGRRPSVMGGVFQPIWIAVFAFLVVIVLFFVVALSGFNRSGDAATASSNPAAAEDPLAAASVSEQAGGPLSVTRDCEDGYVYLWVDRHDGEQLELEKTIGEDQVWQTAYNAEDGAYVIHAAANDPVGFIYEGEPYTQPACGISETQEESSETIPVETPTTNPEESSETIPVETSTTNPEGSLEEIPETE